MADGSIAYAQLVETALMGVVRQVLRDVGGGGLTPPHHFYITFRTDHPGVDMPAELRQRYAQEMTIVLQYQFWDLEVSEERFAVSLSFSGRPHRLSIPFAAVKVFADPGVEFGLQFTLADAEADASETADGDGTPTLVPVAPVEFRTAAASDTTEAAAGDDATDEPPKGGADIVTLDRFRKR